MMDGTPLAGLNMALKVILARVVEILATPTGEVANPGSLSRVTSGEL
jgi:hypothetical protein